MRRALFSALGLLGAALLAAAYHALMPTVEENLAWWTEYDWPEGGGEWTVGYGCVESAWDWVIHPRIRRFLPAGHVLELAPGYGLWTAFLRPMCERMTLVDLTPKCIEACRERYGRKRMSYHVNDGFSLEMIQDGSIDFVFSLHSLVHAGHDVMESYLSQLGRKHETGRRRVHPPLEPRALLGRAHR